jgi:hypothetical protein
MAEPDRKEALELIAEGLRDAEAAIRTHPRKTVKLFESGFHAPLGEQPPAGLIAHLDHIGLSRSERKLVYEYLNSMAFMSAWYHLAGDKTRRDKAAHSAATLAAGAGFGDDFAFKVLFQFEQIWRTTMQQHGIPGSGRGCLGAVVVVVLGTIVLAIWF